MSKHHTRVSEEKRRLLLDKVLLILISAKEPIKINNKTYKKIIMGYTQIINAMIEYADTEEKEFIITNKSTFSKNEKYRSMIDNAKKTRAEITLNNKGLIFKAEPTILDLKILVENLTVENDKLKTELARKQNIIKTNEFNESVNNKNKIGSFIPADLKQSKATKILAKTLSILSSYGYISIVENPGNNLPTEVLFRTMGQTHKLSNFEDIREYVKTYIESKNDIDTIKIKPIEEI